MRWLILPLLVACGCGGGTSGRLVAPSAAPALRTNEGLLIVASESERTTLRFCRDGVGECAVLGPTLADGETLVYALAAGRWCLTHVSCEPEQGDVAQHDVPDDEVLCVEIPAQQIVYPGHVHFDRSVDAQRPCAGRATFLLHHDVDAEIATAHPGLRSPRITLAQPAPLRTAH